MYNLVKSKLESAFNLRIYRNTLPHGTDLFVDLDRHFGLHNFHTVFDIGANIGQSALAYAGAFKVADIYSFEPVSSPYRELISNTKGNNRIRCINSGMGKNIGNIQINVNPDSRVSSILHPRPEDHPETIAIDTVSNFCDVNNIKKIDFLKIDTEGYEMEVLNGSISLLENQQVRVIFLECEPIAKSDYFVSFPELSSFLYGFKYELFGIYEQHFHWESHKNIKFFNAVFISNDMALLK